MSEQFWISLFTLLAVIVSGVQSWLNGRRIKEVHDSTNGKMDKLLKVTGESEFAKGQKQERDDRNAP